MERPLLSAFDSTDCSPVCQRCRYYVVELWPIGHGCFWSWMRRIHLENNMILANIGREITTKRILIIKVVLPFAARAKVVSVADCGRRYGIITAFIGRLCNAKRQASRYSSIADLDPRYYLVATAFHLRHHARGG